MLRFRDASCPLLPPMLNKTWPDVPPQAVLIYETSQDFTLVSSKAWFLTCCRCCSFWALHRTSLGAERELTGLFAARPCTTGLATHEVEAIADMMQCSVNQRSRVNA